MIKLTCYNTSKWGTSVGLFLSLLSPGASPNLPPDPHPHAHTPKKNRVRTIRSNLIMTNLIIDAFIRHNQLESVPSEKFQGLINN